MKFWIRFFVCITALVLFIGVYAARVWVMPRAVSEVRVRETPEADTALRVMSENCGKCHSPGLPTTDAKALAVFDLAEKPWYGRVTDERLAKIVKRIRGTKQISEEDKTAVDNFIQSVRSGK